MYYRYGGGEGVTLCLYVDDILIFGTSIDEINDVKSFLFQNFDMKYLREANVILNSKLNKGENLITLLQSHYMDCKPSTTLYDYSLILRKNKRLGKDHLRYSQIISSLMYLASATRPDISVAISKWSRFSSNAGSDHWCGIDQVMHYLKGTMSYAIHYFGYLEVFEGYCDSNWILEADELKATSGYIFTLGGGAVSWRSCK